MTNIMIQGTTSSAGKSFIATALCRIFKEDGYKVAPFKSQNMSSKYYETIEGYRISTAQALQAKAAGIEPNPNMNPILLIPNSDKGSDVIINGKFYKRMEALEYFSYKNKLKPTIEKAYQELEKEHHIIVLEGAGSPAEINLKQNDIVNMGIAEMVDAPVLLVGDIDRGGVFASLYGTVMLLEEEERKRIKGLIINKFRGDKRLLNSGIKMIEELLNIPVIGTIPYTPLELVDEDSLIDYEKRCNISSQRDEELEEEFKKLSQLIRQNLDMDYVYSLLNI
ncbi:adenosylcobyric acid synthase (glutamine-hydrolysing) [Keratinibaculum paraultunense]|uniref:Cobyric acid synthase n=1 Tax=Keratinibaculum paraultunense TaxID=1278232 RepID=A0A4R3L299_9FIRM|nr:cobyric acid synthase [Keratinibaculum paraultunense]QQY78954.1 cobyric acid synthase [Keratinibaculum paraultunense]TCS90572.1 adenosylcobyric acid synthase (glutamine-hydrolysing) [Keratinibaculum paraultunense]